MSDETYNDWSNRETWAFNLHWQNDQDLYNVTLDEARAWAEDYPLIAEADVTGSHMGEVVVNYWRDVVDSYAGEYGTGLPEVLAMMRDEVGSWWRINRAEVGAAVRESLDNES